jgi:hypothetical protein
MSTRVFSNYRIELGVNKYYEVTIYYYYYKLEVHIYTAMIRS